MTQKRLACSYQLRVQVLDALRSGSQRGVSEEFGIPRWTLRQWLRNEAAIRDFSGPRRQQSRTNGRKEIVPFANHLVMFMKDHRRAEKLLSATAMIQFIKTNYNEWLQSYISLKRSVECAYDSLMMLMRRFANRHGFSQRAITFSVENQEVLRQMRDDFSKSFWARYASYDHSDIINIDETGIYYDMLPSKTLAVRGGSAKVANVYTHSARLTAVLAIRADGRKLPILSITKGSENGYLRNNELIHYPKGHFYTCQKNAWMDSRVWGEYLREVLAPEIEGLSVVVVDNFHSHVFIESESLIASELNSILQPLPPNSTSICQPLDVGVMGPLKIKLRSEWLGGDEDGRSICKRKAHRYDPAYDQGLEFVV